VVKAWPRSAQLAVAFLLGVLVTLLTVQAWAYLPYGSRPATLDRSGEPNYRIDVNRADRAELLQLPGVGESLAGRIEEHRQQHGRFEDVEQLRQVKGIGPARLASLKPFIEAGPDTGDQVRSEKPARSPATKKATAKGSDLTQPIDINRATLTELQRLPGIGPKTAERIVEERQKKPFASVDDLRRVPRIGPKTLERLRPLVTVTMLTGERGVRTPW
jgi:competence protein ComEA